MASRDRALKDRPCKVICELDSPIAGPDLPRLDAICEVILASRAKSITESSGGESHEYEIVGRGQEIAENAQGKLPIPIKRKRSPCGLYVPCASNPIGSESMQDEAAYYAKAFPLARTASLLPQERVKIATTGGRYKSMRLPLRVQVIERIVWFAVLREQLSQLRNLLKECTHVGKKTSYGYGRVRRWIVEPCERDMSWFAESEEGPVLMRTLPVSIGLPEGCIGASRSFGGCVGPYWQQAFWREIWEPC